MSATTSSRDAPWVLACDLGGTRMKIGVVRDGRVLAHSVEPAHSKHGLAPQLPVLKFAWLRLLKDLGVALSDCRGASMAFPSIIDPANGRVLADYGKFSDALGIDLCAWSAAELGLPLAVENDARLALIGEWRHGAGAGCDDLVMITLGTGLGTCAVIEGRVLRGRHAQAGIMGGHFALNLDGRPCVCGNIGCAETEASTASLPVLATQTAGWDHSPLQREVRLDYSAVFHHAAAGDPCAMRLRDRSLAVWSALTVSLIHAYDPERVILGGGIMASADVILPAVRSHVERHAHTPWGKVQVLASQLGDHAALVAGAWLLDERFSPH